jgi:hypothetical protein
MCCGNRPGGRVASPDHQFPTACQVACRPLGTASQEALPFLGERQIHTLPDPPGKTRRYTGQAEPSIAQRARLSTPGCSGGKGTRLFWAT